MRCIPSRRLTMPGFGFGLVFCISICPVLAADSDRDLLGVLAESYSQNREGFSSFSCKFTVDAGLASTREDALAGKLQPGPIGPRKGLWIVDGTRARYEILCDPKDIERFQKAIEKRIKEGGEGPASTNCADRVRLDGNGYRIKFGPFIHGANLFGRNESDGEGIRMTPFNMDVMGADEFSNPARYMRSCLSGRFQFVVKGTQTINDLDLIVVQVHDQKGPKGEPIGPTLGFDPKAGYLARYISLMDTRTGMIFSEVFVNEVKSCSGDRWFPTKVTVVRNSDAPPPFQVERLTVTELDADHRPEADDFKIDLPAGTMVSTPGKDQWLTLAQAESFSPDTLPALEERMVETGKKHLAAAKQPRKPDAGASWAGWIALINVVALGLIAIVFFVRRRKPSAV